MRTLCLCLQRDEAPSVAENFLAFSPRVHYRDPGMVFVDITSTAGLFGGEQNLLKEALKVSKEFFPETKAAISDTPWGAQLFCQEKSIHISTPRRELEELDPIPLQRLHDLEGLIAWSSQEEVESIIDFFHMLGLHKIGELKRFQVDSMRQRWQTTGTLIWKRLHGLDKQVISPLLPTDSLKDYVYLDFPVSLISFLLHCLERSLKRLMARLQGRGEFAQKVVLQLFCEYSGKMHLIELMPSAPGRNLDLFMKLLENKLAGIHLENPIKDFEIEVVPCPEKIQQLDFWEPQIADKDKLEELVSVFNQASLTTGFLHPKDEILPENSWDLTGSYQEYEPIEDAIDVCGTSLQLKPSYSRALSSAPRPSRLLKKPRRLMEKDIHRMQFLSTHPIERLEESWWESSRGRDYFFATSPQGQFLWIYYDRIENEYFLHGYFD